jgi:ABC-type glutathione transport system ATPase component
VAAILGETGSGKTLFGRCIYENLKKKRDFLRDPNGSSEYKPILTSSLNAESQMKFLSIWRPIIQMMLTIHSQKNIFNPE